MEAPESQTKRQHWMGILARATLADVVELLATLDGVPPYEIIKRPETGTLMLEARAGGTGRRFNTGEATMTRCVIRLGDGTMGFSYALGRDRKKAETSAVLDAVLQGDLPPNSALWRGLDRLAQHQKALRDQTSRKAAATKVNFFTLVRGDG